MLLPTTCVLCGAGGAVVCSTCHAGLRGAPALPPPMLVDRCSALLHYHSSGALLPALKNRARRDLIAWLAGGMAALADVPPSTLVTWVPTTAARRRDRGFDQAELLAAAVARRLGLRCEPLLRRSAGPAQAGRSASERATHAGFACVREPGHEVLIVDDVVTTGATLTAAARALRAAGAAEVHAVVAARAPSPRARDRSGAAAGSGLR